MYLVHGVCATQFMGPGLGGGSGRTKVPVEVYGFNGLIAPSDMRFTDYGYVITDRGNRLWMLCSEGLGISRYDLMLRQEYALATGQQEIALNAVAFDPDVLNWEQCPMIRMTQLLCLVAL